MSLTDALLLEGFYDAKDVWIALRTDGVYGSGTQSDPYDGSSYQKFDLLMNSIPEYAIIHLGPGVFETQGYSGSTAGFRIKRRQKIRGSGIDVTVVKLVQATVADRHYVAFGNDPFSAPPADYVEISDLTVDCNLDGQPSSPNLTYARVACAAVGLLGSQLLIRRIKAINWGTKSLQVECFVICINVAHPYLPSLENPGFIHSGIEQCIAVQPAQNCVFNSTILCIAGSEDPFSHVQAFGSGPFIRNCFVDSGYKRKDNGQPFDSFYITSKPDLPGIPGTKIVEGPPGTFTGIGRTIVWPANTFNSSMPTRIPTPIANGRASFQSHQMRPILIS